MNDNFVSLVDNMIKNNPSNNSKDDIINDTDRIKNSFFLRPITVSEMKNYIYSLNKNKSTPSNSPKIIFLHLSA